MTNKTPKLTNLMMLMLVALNLYAIGTDMAQAAAGLNYTNLSRDTPVSINSSVVTEDGKKIWRVRQIPDESDPTKYYDENPGNAGHWAIATRGTNYNRVYTLTVSGQADEVRIGVYDPLDLEHSWNWNPTYDTPSFLRSEYGYHKVNVTAEIGSIGTKRYPVFDGIIWSRFVPARTVTGGFQRVNHIGNIYAIRSEVMSTQGTTGLGVQEVTLDGIYIGQRNLDSYFQQSGGFLTPSSTWTQNAPGTWVQQDKQGLWEAAYGIYNNSYSPRNQNQVRPTEYGRNEFNQIVNVKNRIDINGEYGRHSGNGGWSAGQSYMQDSFSMINYVAGVVNLTGTQLINSLNPSDEGVVISVKNTSNLPYPAFAVLVNQHGSAYSNQPTSGPSAFAKTVLQGNFTIENGNVAILSGTANITSSLNKNSVLQFRAFEDENGVIDPKRSSITLGSHVIFYSDLDWYFRKSRNLAAQLPNRHIVNFGDPLRTNDPGYNVKFYDDSSHIVFHGTMNGKVNFHYGTSIDFNDYMVNNKINILVDKNLTFFKNVGSRSEISLNVDLSNAIQSIQLFNPSFNAEDPKFVDYLDKNHIFILRQAANNVFVDTGYNNVRPSAETLALANGSIVDGATVVMVPNYFEHGADGKVVEREREGFREVFSTWPFEHTTTFVKEKVPIKQADGSIVYIEKSVLSHIKNIEYNIFTGSPVGGVGNYAPVYSAGKVSMVLPEGLVTPKRVYVTEFYFENKNNYKNKYPDGTDNPYGYNDNKLKDLVKVSQGASSSQEKFFLRYHAMEDVADSYLMENQNHNYMGEVYWDKPLVTEQEFTSKVDKEEPKNPVTPPNYIPPLNEELVVNPEDPLPPEPGEDKKLGEEQGDPNDVLAAEKPGIEDPKKPGEPGIKDPEKYNPEDPDVLPGDPEFGTYTLADVDKGKLEAPKGEEQDDGPDPDVQDGPAVGPGGQIIPDHPNSTSTMDALDSIGLTNYFLWRQENETLYQRMGEVRDHPRLQGLWYRGIVGKNKYDSHGRYFQNKYYGIQMGFDRADVNYAEAPVQCDDDENRLLCPRDYSKWIYGVGFTYLQGTSKLENGGNSENWIGTVSAYAVRQWSNGAYLDLIAKISRMDNDFTAVSDEYRYVTKGKYHTYAGLVSAEVGKKHMITDHIYIDPQVQLALGYIKGVDYRTDNGVNVSVKGSASVVGRAGVAVGYETNKGSLYAKVDFLREFANTYKAKYTLDNGAWNKSKIKMKDSWTEAVVGGTRNFNESSYGFVQAKRSFGAELQTKYRIDAGIRFVF